MKDTRLQVEIPDSTGQPTTLVHTVPSHFLSQRTTTSNTKLCSLNGALRNRLAFARPRSHPIAREKFIHHSFALTPFSVHTFPPDALAVASHLRRAEGESPPFYPDDATPQLLNSSSLRNQTTIANRLFSRDLSFCHFPSLGHRISIAVNVKSISAD